LRTISDEFSEDVVIIAEEASFFQLRPEVLLNRYLEINDRSNAQLKRQMGSAIEWEGIKQQIIFSAQRNCSSPRVDDIACYGASTPLNSGETNYLDTSMAIGPVASMRKLFERAWEYILIAEDKARRPNSSTGTDTQEDEEEGPLSRIFGEQNIQREYLRLHHRSNLERLRDATGDFLSRNPEVDDKTNVLDPSYPASSYLARYYPSAPFDFGIGLDYDNELWASEASVTPRTFSDLPTFSGEESTTSLIGDLGTDDPPLQADLPDDIATSTPPFYAPHIPHHKLHSPPYVPLKAQPWSQTPLLADTLTSSVPAALISQSSSTDNSSTWQYTWLASHVPSLLETANAMPRKAVAVTTHKGVRKEWWSLQARDMRNGQALGVMVDDRSSWKGLDEVCGRWVGEGQL